MIILYFVDMARYDYHNRNMGEGYYPKRPKKKKNRLARALVLLLFFAFIIALFVYVFPEVEVTIVPETEAIEHDFEITVDAALDANDFINNKVPGRVVEATDSLERKFQTTGEKNVGEKARGTVVFFNQTGLEQPLTTENILMTDDGVVFHVVGNTTIPKAEVSAEGNIVYGNTSVEIVADEAGEEGNVNPGRLIISDLLFSKQNKIYGEIKNKLSGGTTKVIKVVSEEDLTKARDDLIRELNPKLKKSIEKKLEGGEVLEKDLIVYELVEIEKAVELEEEIENFQMKVSSKAKALVWDMDEVKKVIMTKIESETSEDMKLIQTSRDVFDVEVIEFDVEAGTAKLKIHTVNQISMPIDVNSIRDKIKGKTEFETRRMLLEKKNVRDVRFKFKYSITSKIPDNPNRINIRLDL